MIPNLALPILLAFSFAAEHARSPSAGIAPPPEGGSIALSTSAFCFRTPSCPCGNGTNSSGFGCLNSYLPVHLHGGHLSASGTASVSADTLTLTGDSMPPSEMAIYYQATSALNGGLGLPFSDGLRCIGGSAIRLGTKFNVSVGASSYGALPGDVPISVRGQIPLSGGTFYNQVWYRDSNGARRRPSTSRTR
jgi:hypothetical protein